MPLIRLADVILIYAEATNENSIPKVAIDPINDVRSWIGMPKLLSSVYQVSNKQEIFEPITYERRVDLTVKYHRLKDLRR